MLKQRAEEEPLNVVATAIFFLAILHTFAASRFTHWSHVLEQRHQEKLRRKGSER